MDSGTRVLTEEPVNQQQEMAFWVTKCLGSRKGWKIIPDNDDNSEDINTVALRTVVSMIKDMECQVIINLQSSGH